MTQNSYNTDDRIFVSIASYRDPELQNTLQDIFQKAKNPENIFIGICHQYDMKEEKDRHLFKIPFPRPKQLRIDNIDYRETKGACWARNKIQKLWQGEKWYLTIDSHMKFEQNWDEICVTTCKDLADQGYKPILTTAVCGYEIGQELKPHLPNSRAFFSEEGLARTTGGYALDIKAPIHHALFSGGFNFSLSQISRDIKYDPFIFFLGEEITMAIRFWTSGYDMFVPHHTIAFHLYNPIGVGQQDRALAWEDNLELEKRNLISKKRVLHITKTKTSNDPEVLEDISKYSYGSVRTLRDFERFSGLDFKRKKIREHTKQGLFEKWEEVASIEKVRNIFAKTKDESLQKEYLNDVMKSFPDISSILEIQCGGEYNIENCEILANKNLSYIGVDISEEVVYNNRQCFRNDQNKIFINLDPSNESLLKSELVSCVGMAPFLPIANIWSVLENIRDSGSRYFVFDRCEIKINDKEINCEIALENDSSKRGINLSWAPFHFPEPIIKYPTADGNFAAVYKVSEVSFFMDRHTDKISKLRRDVFDKMEVSFEILKSAFLDLKDGDKIFEEMMLRIIDDSDQNIVNKYREEKLHGAILAQENIKDHAEIVFSLSCSCGLYIHYVDNDKMLKEFSIENNGVDSRWVRILTRDYIKWKLGLSPFIIWNKGR